MAGTSSPKRILISSYAEKDEVVVTVGDSGPGIPSGMRERIFEPFYSTREEGSGIGLNICQRIVLDHGGSIQVSDSPLGGADFILRIPISVEKGTQAR
jgi:signal transduction histidine kinase